MVNHRLKIAIRNRGDRHNVDKDSHNIECGEQVWLYSDRVKDGYARKLSHTCGMARFEWLSYAGKMRFV